MKHFSWALWCSSASAAGEGGAANSTAGRRVTRVTAMRPSEFFSRTPSASSTYRSTINFRVAARLTNQSMWQAESEATKSCSGSAPFACGAPGGMFSFAAFPSSRTVGSNSMRWARLYVPSSNGIPFLCHSVVARWMDIRISLHSKNAEPGFLDRRVERRRDRKREGAARFLGGDHSIVPKPRGGVVGMPLPLVLVADGTLELLLLRFAPGAALRLDAVALHRGEDGSRLLSAHHRDAGVRPHPKEARSESAPAHPVVARAERAADDDGEFRHPAA